MAPATSDELSAKLSSGHSMPLLGLGCWQLKSADPVEAALDAGYRHLDTAYMYTNEKLVGEGIRRWVAKGGGKREDVFVTTKLPMIGMTAAGVDKYLRKSLEKLGLDYVDLYLVHSPLGMLGSHDDDLLPMNDKKQVKMDFSTDLIAVWKAMEAAAAAGLTRSIGVSNYSVKQLRKTLAIATTPPAVQQIELHVRYQQPEMARFCKDNNILLTAYGALGSPGRGELFLTTANLLSLLDEPVVLLVAANHKATTAQVLVKFWLQQGVSVIPKSANPTRIVENAKVYGWQLSAVEMAALKTLDLGAEGRTFLIPKDSVIRQHPEHSDYC